MGEENKENKIWISTAVPENHWTNHLKKRVAMASIDNSFSYIPIDDITSIDMVDAAVNALQDNAFRNLTEWSCSFDLSEDNSFTNYDKRFIRVKIFGLPECPLKKKKLNKKTFIKALMANGIKRNLAESFSRNYGYLKGERSYPKYGDEDWKWLWR